MAKFKMLKKFKIIQNAEKVLKIKLELAQNTCTSLDPQTHMQNCEQRI